MKNAPFSKVRSLMVLHIVTVSSTVTMHLMLAHLHVYMTTITIGLFALLWFGIHPTHLISNHSLILFFYLPVCQAGVSAIVKSFYILSDKTARN